MLGQETFMIFLIDIDVFHENLTFIILLKYYESLNSQIEKKNSQVSSKIWILFTSFKKYFFMI